MRSVEALHHQFSYIAEAATPAFEHGVQQIETIIRIRVEGRLSGAEFIEKGEQVRNPEARTGRDKQPHRRIDATDFLGTSNRICPEQERPLPIAVLDVVADQATIVDKGDLPDHPGNNPGRFSVHDRTAQPVVVTELDGGTSSHFFHGSQAIWALWFLAK